MKQEFLLAEIFWFLDLRAAGRGIHRFSTEQSSFDGLLKFKGFSNIFRELSKKRIKKALKGAFFFNRKRQGTY